MPERMERREFIAQAGMATVGIAALRGRTLAAAGEVSHAGDKTSKVETFAIGPNDFLLNGNPFVIRCGEMHSDRVPPEYWRHRLQMCKAMGLNTVCAYLYWNIHEPREGHFNWQGAADVAVFCHTAQQEGLYIILRPGPYSCAEWEFGGFPWWLLKTPGIQLRTRDARYIAAVQRYFIEVGRHLAPMQITHGGPIIMAQVENEYGSYGSDKVYMGLVRDMLRASGFDVPLFHCDGPTQLPNDHRADIFAVVNFGGGPQDAFAALRQVQPSGPLMCGEYYPGWFDHWGEAHHVGDSQRIVSELKYMLDHKASFSIYMAHGGTSFGFTSGANAPPYGPTVTSYDYDAPISEPGWDTPKFHAIRDLCAQYLQAGETLPPIPARNPVIAVPQWELKAYSPLLSSLGKPVVSTHPQTLEQLDQANACVLYRTTLPAGPAARLGLRELHDYALIYLDGKKIATLDRRRGQSSCALPARPAPARLDILVDTFGRVNYGSELHDRKGITEKVELVTEDSTIEVLNWSHFKLPLDNEFRKRRYQLGKTAQPAFYRGTFQLNAVGDTFLDMNQWSKGVVWVNGHNLGRYWNIGPQQTLYLPAPWLKPGDNEVVVFELNGTATPLLQGLTTPILNQARPEPSRLKRKPGQTIKLDGLTPVLQGTLANSAAWQTIRLPATTTGRYLTLETLNSHSNDAFASLAEIYAQDTNGHDLLRAAWQVVYADSEEMTNEDGSADNVFDLQATTYWHTQWSSQQPPAHPHQLVIDLGRSVTITGLRFLQRPGATTIPARIKDFRVFVTSALPPGL